MRSLRARRLPGVLELELKRQRQRHGHSCRQVLDATASATIGGADSAP